MKSGRGAIVTTFIVCYALTSFIAGYISGGLYSRNGGKSWIKSTILLASLFPFLCFGIGFLLNTVAIFYGSLAAIPFGTIVVVFILWAFISFPLALLGTVVGRNWSGAPNNPCRVKTIPRPITEKNGISYPLLSRSWEARFHLVAYSLRCTLSSHHFGITRCCGLSGRHLVCKKDLQEHQM